MTPSSTSPWKSITRVPEFAAEQQDRQRPHLAGLDQRQQLEHLVERAEPAGEHRDRPRAQQEVHLAQREIVELEAEVRGDVSGWAICSCGSTMLRPIDSAPSSCAPRLAASMIDGPAARADHEMCVPSSSQSHPAGQPGELAGDIVILRLGLQPFGDRALLVVCWPRQSRRRLRRARGIRADP